MAIITWGLIQLVLFYCWRFGPFYLYLSDIMAVMIMREFLLNVVYTVQLIPHPFVITDNSQLLWSFICSEDDGTT